MGLHEIYTKIEDKWYALLDSLDAKGIPVYKVIDPIENAGIPSFPLFSGIIILIILGIIYMAMTPAAPAGLTLTVQATDQEGTAIEAASISIEHNGELIASGKTNPEGTLKLKVPGKKDLIVKLSKEGCEEATKVVSGLEESTTVQIQTQCAGAGAPQACLNLAPGLETVLLADADGYPPKNCHVYVYPSDDPTATMSVDWYVDGDGYLHLSEPEECPTSGYAVKIDCDQMTYEAGWDSFVNQVKLGELTMEDKEPYQPQAQVDLPDDSKINIIVKAESESGVPLEGIEIKATDEDGDELTGYTNAVTSGRTDSFGTITLTLPKGQQFYLTAKDPNGAYHSSGVSGPYTASLTQAFSTIKIKMNEGFVTTIYVKEVARQTPIAGAMVTVKYEGKVVQPETPTDALGKVSFVLLKGVEYELNVRHPKYGAVTGNVTGGGNTTIWMNVVDLAKAGDLEVRVINAHGMKEPLGDVKLKLIKGNTTYGVKDTNDAGLVKFKTVEEGTYTIRALPPGSIAYQEFQNIQVTPGNTTRITLEVMPTQIDLIVTPLICISASKCVPKENVHVELWNSWLEEKVAEEDTKETRKAKFTVDYGTSYYIVASWVDSSGRKYGPVAYSPNEPAYYSQEIEFNVPELTNEAEVNISLIGDNEEIIEEGDDITPGENYNLRVGVSLPMFTGETKFKKIEIEVFVGDVGSLGSIRATPLVIDRVDLNDIATQDPMVVSLEKADEYYYGKRPKPNDVGSSKYIKITLGNYEKANSYIANIPIYVRQGASGTAKINYRAIWTTPDGREVKSNNGLWATKEYSIKEGTTGTRALETGPFYNYDASISTTKEGKGSTSVDATIGSYVYVHFSATARLDTNDWVVDFKSVPEKLEPVAFEGSIKRHDTEEETQITSQEVSGWQIKNTEGLYALHKDDVLNGIITLKAKEGGRASIVLFRDVSKPLNVHIKDIPVMQKDTPIAGITAQLEVSWTDNTDNNLKGSIDPSKDVLPADNKDFTLTIRFSGTTSATATVIVQASDQSITFDDGKYPNTYVYYNDSVEVNDGATLEINGKGLADTIGAMGIFIYETGTEKPDQPWFVLKYGPVSFGVDVKYFMKGEVQPFPTEATDEIHVTVYKNVAGVVEPIAKGVEVKVDSSSTSLETTGEYPYFRWQDSSGLSPEDVTITATSDYFGTLTKTKNVAYIEKEPEYPGYITIEGVPLNEEKDETLNLTNHFPGPVHFDIGELEADGWDISIEPEIWAYNKTSSKWMPIKQGVGTSNVEVPAGQKLVIWIKAKPYDVACLDEARPILTVSSDDALAEPLAYSVKLSCTGEKAITRALTTIITPQFIIRESTPPERIDEFGCQFLNVSDKEYAYLCDAEQLAMAIAIAADKMLKDPTVQSASYTYALGKDELTAAGFDKVMSAYRSRLKKLSNVFENYRAAELSSGHDLVFNGKAGCGAVTVTLEKVNKAQDINVTISQQGEDWCDKNSNAYLVALMNYDKSMRPLFGNYYSFDSKGDNEKIFEAIEYAKIHGNISEGSLFGYGVEGKDPETVVSSITGGQAQSFIRYKECAFAESFNCPGFVKSSMGGANISGYMRIDEYNDVYLGMVYNPQVIPEGALPRYRAAYLSRLMEWVSKGKVSGGNDVYPINTSAYWVYLPEKDRNIDEVVNLTGPDQPNVTLIWISDLGEIRTDVAGTTNVTVRIKTSTNADFCYVYNVLPDGSFVDEGQTGYVVSEDDKKVFEYDNWQLAKGPSGIRRVGAFCVGGSGIPSKIGIGTIKVDQSGLELVGRLPEVVLMFEPFEGNNPIKVGFDEFGVLEFKAMSRYGNVSTCWLEFPDGVPPTDGQLCAEKAAQGNQVCNEKQDEELKVPDPNSDGNIRDGGCLVRPDSEMSDIYRVYRVRCNSPTMWDPEKKKAIVNEKVPVLVKCRNTFGVERTLGETSFYVFGPGAPQIFVPPQFSMGWFEQDGSNITAFDTAIVNGTGYGYKQMKGNYYVI